MYFLYMIQDSQNHLYIGITDNPTRRLEEHNNKEGAEFTKQSSDFRIVFLETYPTPKEARTREIQLKKWSRIKKEKLIDMYKNGIDTKI